MKQEAEMVPLERLKPWDQNPRKNDAAVSRVVKSIHKFGFANPILARRENGEIIAGHTRYKAAQVLGLEEVPVRFLDLDEKQAHLLAIADNKLGEIADWDDGLLGNMLRDVTVGEAGVMGFDADELSKIAGLLDESLPDIKLDESFAVTVTCSSEEEQLKVLEWCQENGIQCRALI